MKLFNQGTLSLRDLVLQKKISSIEATPKITTKFNPADFDIISEISSGSFGRVSLVKTELTLLPFAMKVIPKASIVKDKQIAHILNEKYILSLFSEFIKSPVKINKSEDLSAKPPIIESATIIQSKRIVQLYDTLQDNENLYFLMEFLPGGELARLFQKSRLYMKLDDIKLYMAEIVLVLQELHDKNIVYRDLKLENIMIDRNGHLKLIDFGFAKKLTKDRTFTQWGTEGYIAPEILNNFGHGLPADMWSLGILLCNMISGVMPDTKQKLNKIFMLVSDDLSAKDLIIRLLNIHPENRPTIEEVRNHKFFQDIHWKDIKNQSHKAFFVPDLDNNWDTKYFENATNRHKGCYISNGYKSDSSNDEVTHFTNDKFNKEITQDMKFDQQEHRCKPLGDFKILKINKLLLDF